MGGLGVVLGWSGGAGGRPGALPCSVALVFCKNNASHAAWRSFWTATTHKQSNKQSLKQTIKRTNTQIIYFELSPPQKYRVTFESGASLRKFCLNLHLTIVSDIYI